MPSVVGSLKSNKLVLQGHGVGTTPGHDISMSVVANEFTMKMGDEVLMTVGKDTSSIPGGAVTDHDHDDDYADIDHSHVTFTTDVTFQTKATIADLIAPKATIADLTVPNLYKPASFDWTYNVTGNETVMDWIDTAFACNLENFTLNEFEVSFENIENKDAPLGISYPFETLNVVNNFLVNNSGDLTYNGKKITFTTNYASTNGTLYVAPRLLAGAQRKYIYLGQPEDPPGIESKPMKNGERAHFEYKNETGELILINAAYYVSSEGGFDYLYVFINGKQILKVSGVESKVMEPIELKPNSVLKVEYRKDSSISRGDDVAAFCIINIGPKQRNAEIEAKIGDLNLMQYVTCLPGNFSGEKFRVVNLNKTINKGDKYSIRIRNQKMKNGGKLQIKMSGSIYKNNVYVKSVASKVGFKTIDVDGKFAKLYNSDANFQEFYDAMNSENVTKSSIDLTGIFGFARHILFAGVTENGIQMKAFVPTEDGAHLTKTEKKPQRFVRTNKEDIAQGSIIEWKIENNLFPEAVTMYILFETASNVNGFLTYYPRYSINSLNEKVCTQNTINLMRKLKLSEDSLKLFELRDNTSIDLTKPSNFFEWNFYTKQLQSGHNVVEAINADTGERYFEIREDTADWVCNNSEYKKVYDELKAGVLRKATITNAKYVLCNDVTKRNTAITNNAGVVTFFLKLADRVGKKYEWPYLPCNVGEKVLLKGTGLSLDGMELYMSENGFNDGPLPPKEAAPKHHRDEWNFVSLELPLMIYNEGVDKNNTFTVNAGVLDNTRVGDENMWRPSATVAFYFDPNNDVTFSIPAGQYTPESLEVVVRATMEASYLGKTIFSRARGHFYTERTDVLPMHGPYYFKGREVEVTGVKYYPLVIRGNGKSPLAKIFGLNFSTWSTVKGGDMFPNPTSTTTTTNTTTTPPTTTTTTTIFTQYIGTDDFTFKGHPLNMLYTPLKQSDISEINSGINTGSIEVFHGPVDDRLLHTPNGYANFCACFGDLYRAAIVECHINYKVWAFFEKGAPFRSRIPQSFADLKAMIRLYNVTDATVSDSSQLSIRPFAGYAGEFANYYTHGTLDETLPNGLDVILDFPLPIYIMQYTETAQYGNIAYGDVTGLTAANPIKGDWRNDTITGYIGDWSVATGLNGAKALDITTTNYLEMPFTMVYYIESGIEKLAAWPRYIKPIATVTGTPGVAGEMNGKIRFGIVKKSIVRRVLNLSNEVPDKDVPVYGYFGLNEGSGGFGTSAITAAGAKKDEKYKPIFDYRATNSGNEVMMAWLVEWFNKRNVRYIINDIRNQTGGPAATIDAICNTFGTDRLKTLSFNQTINIEQIHVEAKHVVPQTRGIFDLCENYVFGTTGQKLSRQNSRNTNVLNTSPELSRSLFDRNPNRYLGIDTTLNPNIPGKPKRILTLNSSLPISSTQLNSYEFHGPNMDGYHYINADGKGYDDAVECIQMGQIYHQFGTSFTTSFTYPTASSEIGRLPEQYSTLPFYPVVSATRTDADRYAVGPDGRSSMDLGTGVYHNDFHIDSTRRNFMQDIGFTTDLLNQNGTEKEAFAKLGGTMIFGIPTDPPSKSEYLDEEKGKSNYIPAPTVMPNFFDKKTWRDRIFERGMKIMNDDNWKTYSLKRNKATFDAIYDTTSAYATVQY